MIFSIFKQPARIAMRFVAGGATARGFTLVELMVVMAMTAIMISVALISLSGAKDRKAVETEARKFAAVVREVQNYALTGKAINATNPTCGVGIRTITSATSTFRLRYMYRTGGAVSCAAGFTLSDNADSFNALRSLSDGVRFASDLSDDIYFSVPRGELVDHTATAISVPQLIVLHKNSADYSVCVYPSGAVTETAGALGSCP